MANFCDDCAHFDHICSCAVLDKRRQEKDGELGPYVDGDDTPEQHKCGSFEPPGDTDHPDPEETQVQADHMADLKENR